MWSLCVEFLPADLSDLPSLIEDTLNLYTSELSMAWMIWTQANCPVLPTAGMFRWEGSADKGRATLQAERYRGRVGATMFSLLSLHLKGSHSAIDRKGKNLGEPLNLRAP